MTSLPRLPPDAIVVRTDRFAFHLGAAVDSTWPAHAESTRAALGDAVAAVLEDESAVIPVLSTQLGLAWPPEGLDLDVQWYDVAGAPSVSCDPDDPRPLRVSRGMSPAVFFACALAHGLAKTAAASTLRRALAPAGPRRADALYGCIAAYAATAVVAATLRSSRRGLDALDAWLSTRCEPSQLGWVSLTWVSRVRDNEGVEAYAARALAEASSLSP